MATTTRDLTVAEAVQILADLEAEQERLTSEADSLRTRLGEIDAGLFGRQDAMAQAHRDVIAAAKREST